jgi:hypothetical protein
MRRTAALLFAAVPLTWSVGSVDSTRLAVRLAPLPRYDTLRFDACLPGGAYSIAAWSRDTAWHGIEGTFKVCPRGDLNADGIVNAVDVVLVVNLVYKGMR